jgi:hypothetical protein
MLLRTDHIRQVYAPVASPQEAADGEIAAHDIDTVRQTPECGLLVRARAGRSG